MFAKRHIATSRQLPLLHTFSHFIISHTKTPHFPNVCIVHLRFTHTHTHLHLSGMQNVISDAHRPSIASVATSNGDARAVTSTFYDYCFAPYPIRASTAPGGGVSAAHFVIRDMLFRGHLGASGEMNKNMFTKLHKKNNVL